MTTQLDQELKLIGAALLNISKKLGKALKDVAVGADVSINSVRAVFNGSAHNITTYEKVADYLGTSFIATAVEIFANPPQAQDDPTKVPVQEKSEALPQN